YIPFGTGFDHLVEGNAFKNNALFAILTASDSVDATSNWWGVDGQAPGVGGADAVSGRTGDPTPLASVPSVPALGPRVLLTAAAPAAASGATAVTRPPQRAQRTMEQRHAAGRAGLERFAAARAGRYRWYVGAIERQTRPAQ